MHPIAQIVEDRTRGDGPVDGEVAEVGPAEPRDLGVEVGEGTPLEERVVAVFYAGDHVLGALGGASGASERVSE